MVSQLVVTWDHFLALQPGVTTPTLLWIGNIRIDFFVLLWCMWCNWTPAVAFPVLLLCCFFNSHCMQEVFLAYSKCCLLSPLKSPSHCSLWCSLRLSFSILFHPILFLNHCIIPVYAMCGCFCVCAITFLCLFVCVCACFCMGDCMCAFMCVCAFVCVVASVGICLHV